mmetsp:Transcript_95447/g.189196  ORF Transcript_95447/g.189196 Transcript_95447/m.189196 type:complete len:743 (+) Transcript_95447:180-2408(+)
MSASGRRSTNTRLLCLGALLIFLAGFLTGGVRKQLLFDTGLADGTGQTQLLGKPGTTASPASSRGFAPSPAVATAVVPAPLPRSSGPPVPQMPVVAVSLGGATCEFTFMSPQSSRPGKPCLPPAKFWPYASNSSGPTILGERIVAAATQAPISREECNEFVSSGDHTWCNKVMGGKGIVGLSFANEEQDAWSEHLSREFSVPTHLYNCQQAPDTSTNAEPLPYQRSSTCLGPEKATWEGKNYETLVTHLGTKEPLSVHLKLDTEASGWLVLERFLSNVAVLQKVRTLDLKAVFGIRKGFETELESVSGPDILEREVRVMEQLRDHFRVAGSDLETYRQGWRPETDCPQGACEEPNMHLAGGFAPFRFTVSYVSKTALPIAVAAGGSAAGAIGHAIPPAPALPISAGTIPPVVALPVSTPSTGKTCTWVLKDQVSSRPGVPCLPPALVWPYVTNTPWRTTLGERIVNAVTPRITAEECDGFDMYGDQTWCNKGMRDRTATALSFGIEERDLFSERMSNVLHLPCKLFDCFVPPEQSPPMSGKAPNGTGPCPKDGPHCYETPYFSYRVCVGPKATVIDQRRYDTLASVLRGYRPLSLHLKMDVEGSEWDTLQALLESDSDMGKIRTLDMEVHFGFHAASSAAPEVSIDKQIAGEVTILEKLRKRFRVVGTTLETYRQGWWPEKDCPKQQCHEPVVHTSGGFSPQMFAVSYINAALVPSTSDDTMPRAHSMAWVGVPSSAPLPPV